MFLKKTRSDGKLYLQIVESYRDEKGISRHRVICNLGRLDGLRQNESARKIILEVLELLLSDEDKPSADCSVQQRFHWEQE